VRQPDIDVTAGFVAELSDEQGRHLVLLAERLPRETRVRTARREQRRLASLLRRASREEREGDRGAAPWIMGEPPAGLGRELCSAHFVSGAGWAWRVTAALVGDRPPVPVRREAKRRGGATPPCTLVP
jgi:hypothetical protein